MLNQTFDLQSLLRLTRRHEIIKFSLGRQLEDYKISLSEISEIIESENYEINSCISFDITSNNKTNKIYSVTTAEDYYALKKITDNIKRLYRVKFASRHEISEQILKIFEDSSDMKIIRIDIASFFESIKIKDIIKRLKNDNILSKKSLYVLENIVSKLGMEGLPRGLPISSPLSEIFMEQFDNHVKSLEGVYYYSRYVDDIILISTNVNSNLEVEIIQKLDEIKLKINNKTEIKKVIKNSSIVEKVNYLGYEYILNPVSTPDISRKRNVDVKMSKNKINKIKTRIVLSLINYNMQNKRYRNMAINNLHNYFRNRILRKRIHFLSGNYEIPNNKNQHSDDAPLKGGIYYNSPLLNTPEQLTELNEFLVKLLFTKKNSLIGRRVRRIPIKIRRELASTDFKNGFESRITHKFLDTDLKEICEIWK